MARQFNSWAAHLPDASRNSLKDNVRFFVIALVVSVSASLSAAQTTRPTTRPTSDTPAGALRLLNIALLEGDSAAVKQLIDTNDSQEQRLVGAMADYAAALATLHKEAIKAFGKTGANAITGDADAQSAEGLDAIDNAEVSVAGDTATVHYKTAGDAPVQLKKISGQWKLPLSQLISGADRGAEQSRLEEFASQSRLAQQTADEIAKGKYKSADDAAHAWQGRLLDVVLASSSQKKGT